MSSLGLLGNDIPPRDVDDPAHAAWLEAQLGLPPQSARRQLLEDDLAEALLSRRHHPRTARLDPMHPKERAGRAIGYPTPGDRNLPLGDREGPILGRVRRQLVDGKSDVLR